MAKRDPFAFNFGANAKPRKKKAKKPKKAGKGRGGKSNAWRSYVGDNSPIPD